jgi:hypothetical protein
MIGLAKRLAVAVMFKGRKEDTYDNERHIKEATDWIFRAQDASADGGVAIRFSLIRGWEPSYPETTGYIIPTLLTWGESVIRADIIDRVIQMADWLVNMQKADGSFDGGAIGSKLGSLVFDTGQIVFGLLSTYKNTCDETYLRAADKAGLWLVKVQHENGSWEKYAFESISHSYYSRVAWALLELYKITDKEIYKIAAIRNIDWVLSNQEENGWFRAAGFTKEENTEPTTHTIAYTIRGVLECGAILGEEKYLLSAKKAADALLKIVEPEGFFWGTYDSRWSSSSRYSCLTGNAQISIIFLRVCQLFMEKSFYHAAKKLNSYLKKKQSIDTGVMEVRGAIPGSWPIWGKYERFSFPNWATKFFIDAQLLEEKVKIEEGKDPLNIKSKRTK